MSAITGRVDRGAIGVARHVPAVLSEECREALPWHDDPAGSMVAADARLDNRRDLFSALSLPASVTLPDRHLILAAWQKWGRNCPRYLVGDFAFAIWDPRQHTLFSPATTLAPGRSITA